VKEKTNSMELLEKLIVAQIVEKFLVFYGSGGSQEPATGPYQESNE
jgi:hypothetical protein